MKKYLVIMLLPLLLLCSCVKTEGEDDEIGLSPAGIIDAVYEKIDPKEYMQQLKPELETVDINAENEEYYLGISGVPYESGAGSEAVIQPVTYSFCVIKLKKGINYDAERKKIEQNINKAKWVCARADEAYVVRQGRYIAVIMGAKEACDDIEAAFLAVTLPPK